MKQFIVFIALAGFVLTIPYFVIPPVRAQNYQAQDSSTLTLYIENDVFAGTDREYTNGMKLTWISQDFSDFREGKQLPCWSNVIIELLPFVNRKGYQKTLSLSFGQNMYTPDDIEAEFPAADTRPYAGITYFSIGFHGRNQRIMDSLELSLGMVGPHSYAEECQKRVHIWTDSDYPNGWDNQIEDEFIANLYFERKLRLLSSELWHDLAWDIIPHVGCAFGNAFIAANTGTQLRCGWHLPNDFGTYQIRPGSDSNAPLDENDPRFLSEREQIGIHTFLAFDINAVFHNILLDGNIFRKSYSVEKEPYVSSIIWGIGVILERWKITYSYVLRSKEFKTQENEQVYGSITLSYTF